MSHNGSQAPSDELTQHGRRVQELLAEMEACPDAAARELLQECMREVLAFYGLGLSRVIEVVKNAPGKQGAYEALVEDSVVRGLLLIHGLHPVPIEARLRAALDKVRPYMESHGGNVELISVEDEVARLRLVGHCQSCPSSALTLELALKQAIEEACPDLVSFECEGVAQPPAPRESHVPNAPPHWTVVDGAHGLAEGGLLSLHASEAPLVICQSAGQLYAYRDRCPACNLPLHLGSLRDGALSCSVGHRYDVRHAGRALDGSSSHLDPVPLLVEAGVVRVALSAPAAEDGSRAMAEINR